MPSVLLPDLLEDRYDRILVAKLEGIASVNHSHAATVIENLVSNDGCAIKQKDEFSSLWSSKAPITHSGLPFERIFPTEKVTVANKRPILSVAFGTADCLVEQFYSTKNIAPIPILCSKQ